MNFRPSDDQPDQLAAVPAQAAAEPKRPQAVFVTGSTMRHVITMTATGSIGLMAIFLVDFLSLLYVSWLGRPAATAGVGFATLVLFLSTSVNIGFLIAVSALASKEIGAGNRQRAREIAGSTIALMVMTSVVVAGLMLAATPTILRWLGASGEAYDTAFRFLMIAMPSNILMALGMGFSGALRAVGDAKKAMYVTLSGGIVTAGLDPLLIFWAGLGTDGAAWATVVSRISFVIVGYWGAVMVHDIVARPRIGHLAGDMRLATVIAVPAVLTNLATPVANIFVASTMSQFGDKAVAAFAIIDRIVPLAFGVLFALSGAVGPILGQNWGARRFDRMRQTLKDATLFCAAYVLPMWLLLMLGQNQLVELFHVTGLTAELLKLFTVVSGPMWLTLGGLFVANAAFNNLGYPLYSTAFNWGRATIGTLPLVWLGAHFGGVHGALYGVAAGGALFGVAALIVAFRTLDALEAAPAK
ncbi:MAG: MATE family efflux transporter [Hyphomicrobiales bacterium]|nr:MATE family efflux transporter [Hyphomicrobiales bacterium]